MHFFHISTSKHAPNVVCFAHFNFEICFAPLLRALFEQLNFQKRSENGLRFDFEMRFAPQRRALFQRLNCQMCSEPEAFLTYSLPHVLRATRACMFVVSYLTRWLRTRRFSDPTFRPSGAPKHWKTQCFATVLPFCAPWSSFFFLSLLWSSFFWLSLLWIFPPLLLHLSILSEASLLNFLRKIH